MTLPLPGDLEAAGVAQLLMVNAHATTSTASSTQTHGLSDRQTRYLGMALRGESLKGFFDFLKMNSIKGNLEQYKKKSC